MDLLYKYYQVNKYSKENLKNEVVLFNNLLCFNDPFEGIGQFLYDVSPEEQKYWNQIGSDLPKGLAERIANDSKENLTFNNRIFCATEKYDSPLMWAHYANSHAGFCVGYSKDEIKAISTKFGKVAYQSQPYKVNLSQINMEEIESLLFIKSKAWRYEEEWRALYSLKDEDVLHLSYSDNFSKCFQPNEERDKFYVPHGYVQMSNLEVLESNKFITKHCRPQVIYLGLRMTQKDSETVIEIGKEKSLKIYRISQIQNSFKMTSHEI